MAGGGFGIEVDEESHSGHRRSGGSPFPRIVVETAPDVKPRRFYVLSADIEAHGHTGGCPGCAALASHGKATKPHNDECRERIRTIKERTLTGKARMNAYKELSEVQEMCLWNLGTEMMSRWRLDRRTHLAVTSEKTSAKRAERETSTLVKEDQRQQVKTTLTS